MIRTIISGALKMRVALWAIELALPSGSDLKQRFQSGLLGIVAAVAGGVLAAFVALALVAALGYGLHYYGGVTVAQAIIATAAIILIIMIGLFAYGKAKLTEAFSAFERKSPSSIPSETDTLREIINGFVEGLVADEGLQRNNQPSPVKKAA